MGLEHSPETDGFGLVLLPELIDPSKISYFAPSKYVETINRHHLYWPKSLYNANELTRNFREHPFNSIWLLKSDHVKIHQTYDGVAVPDTDVMASFMDEAGLLESLQVSLKAIEMIDSAILAGRIKRISKSEDEKNRYLQIASGALKNVRKFELLNANIAKTAVERAISCLNENSFSLSA